MAEIIATGTTELASDDFTLTGAGTTLYLKNATGPVIPPTALAYVQIKSGTAYFNVGQLTGAVPQLVLTATGTFRVLRAASPTAFGVDRD